MADKAKPMKASRRVAFSGDVMKRGGGNRASRGHVHGMRLELNPLGKA